MTRKKTVALQNRAFWLAASASLMATIGMTGTALAADMGEPAPVIEGPAKAVMSEFGSGWYLRGDVSYVSYETPKANYSVINFEGEKLKESFGVGGGFGYKFLSWFRADVTVDYRTGSDFSARTSVAGCCYSSEGGKISTWTSFLNGYIDLGSWYGFTPYVGAGIGAGGGRFKEYIGYNYTNAGVLTSTATFFGKEKTNLAWALMAGAAVDLGYGFALDVGYRYAQFGDIVTQTDVLGNAVRLKDNATHEVRVGLRYMIE
jgi:opacity protein-like surface antigen